MSQLNIRNDFRRHVIQYYNRYASLYDFSEFIRRGTRRKAIKLSGWHLGENVLDLCTGTGELALAFARQGAEVVGADIARGMLKRAAAKSIGPNPAWVEIDATDLPNEARSADTFIA